MLLYARSEGLRQMGKWVIALLATGVALVAASARAQTGQVLLGPTVYSSRNLPANAITGFTVGCPRGYFAVSGGVSSPGPGSTLLSVRPVGLRAYTFRFGNPVTKVSTRVTVLVACRTIRRGPVLIVKPVKTRLVVRPGQIKSGALACPANTTPAGSAIDLDPGRSRSIDSFAGAALSVRTSTATLRAFQFTIANAGARAQEVVVQGTCATVLFASAAERASLNTRISTYTDAISPGRHRLRHRCLGGWTAMGTGYSLGSGAVRIEGAAAFAADGRWWVRNTSSAPLRAELQLVCGRLT